MTEIAVTETQNPNPNIESSQSAVTWPAIFAGAVAATGVTLALLPLGSALGFASFSIWTLNARDAAEFTFGAAIWLVVMQWLSSFIGGYLAGRLRVKWAGIHADEVFFRDTAHGLLSWCLATLAVAVLIGGLAAGAGDTAAEVASDVSTTVVEKVRQAGVGFSTALAISLFVGAFIASVAGAIGGRLRDAL
ncbi:hypothetical protein ABI_08020 [Asticcacaulis biprosthecium C19]|uniref:Uncharacterized protein n=1 Tax=Asticcacaulis biprosthecium C19 TaxID=715226 RepID=F4QLU7_9CAUL|nr:hypothetical protein [Asticcacaulis biprosthecium]EGF92366.1 hypothetical protein ABI_08020 [Asticcacaulis biprosthecium C19]